VRVCFQISHLTGRPCGVWWEVGDDELDSGYVDPITTVALAGVQEMLARPPGRSWHEHWQRLSDRVSPWTWWEVAEVNDESYCYELLFHLDTCNPLPVDLDWEVNMEMLEMAIFDDTEEDELDDHDEVEADRELPPRRS
jgi:hypothetical protein